MIFAKISGDALQYWTGHITIDGRDIFTTDPIPYGYKVVVYTDPPTQDGMVAVQDGWEETETEIRQKWALRPAPEPAPDVEKIEAQGLYTATMTDTLLEEESNE